MTFPSSIPPELLAGVGIVTVSLLLTEAGLTLGWGYLAARRDGRRDRVRERIRHELLERTYAAEPAWAAWVETLDGTERAVATELLETYLRQITGADRQALLELADTLDIGQTARETLDTGDRYERLRALTWLNFRGPDCARALAGHLYSPSTDACGCSSRTVHPGPP